MSQTPIASAEEAKAYFEEKFGEMMHCVVPVTLTFPTGDVKAYFVVKSWGVVPNLHHVRLITETGQILDLQENLPAFLAAPFPVVDYGTR